MTSISSVLMDSHLYDYHSFTDDERKLKLSVGQENAEQSRVNVAFCGIRIVERRIWVAGWIRMPIERGG